MLRPPHGRAWKWTNRELTAFSLCCFSITITGRHHRCRSLCRPPPPWRRHRFERNAWSSNTSPSSITITGRHHRCRSLCGQRPIPLCGPLRPYIFTRCVGPVTPHPVVCTASLLLVLHTDRREAFCSGDVMWTETDPSLRPPPAVHLHAVCRPGDATSCGVHGLPPSRASHRPTRSLLFW